MKRTLCIVLLAALCPLTVICEDEDAEPKSLHQDKRYVVRARDYGGEEMYEVMTSDKIKEVEFEIRKEIGCYQRAMFGAEREWRKAGLFEGRSFPRSALSRRNIRVMGKYQSDEAAWDKVAKLEDRKKELEEEAWKRKTRGKSKEEIEKLKEEEAEKERFQARAVDFFMQALEEARNPAAKEE